MSERLWCVEWIIVKDGKTRLIILDNLPESKYDYIESFAPDNVEKIKTILKLYPEYGFADKEDYNDCNPWDLNVEGCYLHIGHPTRQQYSTRRTDYA